MREAKNPVRSVQRSLEILEVLRESDGERLSDIEAQVGLSKGTIHCHLATLEERGYVTSDGNEYRLGLRFLDFAHYAREQVDVFDVVTPRVDAIAEETGEMAVFTVEENGKGVLLYKADGEKSVRTEDHVGYRTDLYRTAVGKAILAFLPVEKRDRIVRSTSFEPYTPKTVTDEADLYEELEQIRDERIAYNVGESVHGLVGVATPIVGQDETVHGAIAVVGPASRLTDDRMRNDLSERLHKAANIVEVNITSL